MQLSYQQFVSSYYSHSKHLDRVVLEHAGTSACMHAWVCMLTASEQVFIELTCIQGATNRMDTYVHMPGAFWMYRPCTDVDTGILQKLVVNIA